MKHILSFIIIGVAGYKIAQSFMHPEVATVFLGMEVNVWAFRLIWLLAGVLSGYSILRARKLNNNK